MTSDDWYCKIYVDVERDRAWLVQVAAAGARVGCFDSFDSDTMSVDVRRNEDFDLALRGGPGGFLHYRYYLDVLPTDSIDRHAYVTAVSRLLERLWTYGTRAIASCDFEGDLPSVPDA